MNTDKGFSVLRFYQSYWVCQASALLTQGVITFLMFVHFIGDSWCIYHRWRWAPLHVWLLAALMMAGQIFPLQAS